MKKIVVLLMITSFLTISCNKEDISLLGKLSLNFKNTPYLCSIYDLNDKSNKLFEFNNMNEISIDVNMGNYYCIVYDQNITYSNVTFQVQPGKHTIITFDANGNSTTEYK